MKVSADPAYYHKLYGSKALKKPRVIYYKKDFIDYVLMMVVSALVIGFSRSSSGMALSCRSP
jgi:hypothetical protein